MWLGSWKTLISWPKQYVSTLGVVFAFERRVADKINFDEWLDKLKKVLTGGHLTILGRIAIVKTLALSKLIYNYSVLELPVDFEILPSTGMFSPE